MPQERVCSLQTRLGRHDMHWQSIHDLKELFSLDQRQLRIKEKQIIPEAAGRATSKAASAVWYASASSRTARCSGSPFTFSSDTNFSWL